MKVIDPGHSYELDSYDGGEPIRIDFMKREGEGYPGNIGHHSGTNLQELFRVAIDRDKYLNNQVHDGNNDVIICKCREILWLLEERAARRHNIDQFDFRPDLDEMESIPYCTVCGHIVCRGHHER